MTGTTGWEYSVMKPFCTSTTTSTGLRSFILCPVAVSEDLDRLGEVTVQSASLHYGVAHRAVL